jgi:O-antigen ligase
MFKSAPLFGIGFNGFTDLYEITAHNSFVLCLAELGLLGSTLWLALLVTTMMGLKRSIGVQKKWQAARYFGLRHLFDASSLKIAGPLHGNLAPSVGIITLNYPCAREMLPAMVTSSATDLEIKIEPMHSPSVPQHWVVAMRLALVAFMTSGWFLSRSYTTPMYLVLGLATATIALQGNDGESHERGHSPI